jgi:hypothetical protein
VHACVGMLAMTIYQQMVLMLAWRLLETLDHGKENARWLLNYFFSHFKLLYKCFYIFSYNLIYFIFINKILI